MISSWYPWIDINKHNSPEPLIDGRLQPEIRLAILGDPLIPFDVRSKLLLVPTVATDFDPALVLLGKRIVEQTGDIDHEFELAHRSVEDHAREHVLVGHRVIAGGVRSEVVLTKGRSVEIEAAFRSRSRRGSYPLAPGR